MSPSRHVGKATAESKGHAITLQNKVMTRQGIGEDFEKRIIEVSEHDFNARRIIKALNIDPQKRF